MKLFEDLPSTDTPINAENLNQIQDNLVVVSATEPTGDNREKVWMQKGKNLLNITQNRKDVTEQFSNIIRGDMETVEGETYTISFNTTNNGGKVYVHETAFTYGSVVCDGTRKTVTVKGKTTRKWKNTVILTAEETVSTPYDLSNIQIERNSYATQYEEYIKQKIYVKNNNNIYEEFTSKEDLADYSTGEQKVGIWINGKPLYRKVITGTTPSTIEDTKVFSISNIEILVSINGTIDNWLPINSTVSAENCSILYYLFGDFKMAIGSSLINKPFMAIVEYTKTTD